VAGRGRVIGARLAISLRAKFQLADIGRVWLNCMEFFSIFDR